MAGDWIKMRTGLAEDPAVIGIAEMLKIEEDLVVGKLHRFWSWADQQTIDGVVYGVTGKWVDRHLGIEGFTQAMSAVNWLLVETDGISIPNFGVHNGKSAKHRCDTAARVAKTRLKHRNENVTETCYNGNKKKVISRTLRKQIFDRDENTCVYCGRKKGEFAPPETKSDGILSVDHIIPESRGGGATLENLVTCCNPCNNKKGNRTPHEAAMPIEKSVTVKRYKLVTKTLPEKRREEKSNKKPPKPPRGGSAATPKKRSTASTVEIKFPTNLDTAEFKTLWIEWVEYRKSIKHHMPNSTQQRQLNWLSSRGMETAVKIIDHTIMKGWRGLRELDDEQVDQVRVASPASKAALAEMKKRLQNNPPG